MQSQWRPKDRSWEPFSSKDESHTSVLMALIVCLSIWAWALACFTCKKKSHHLGLNLNADKPIVTSRPPALRVRGGTFGSGSPASLSASPTLPVLSWRGPQTLCKPPVAWKWANIVTHSSIVQSEKGRFPEPFIHINTNLFSAMATSLFLALAMSRSLLAFS